MPFDVHLLSSTQGKADRPPVSPVLCVGNLCTASGNTQMTGLTCVNPICA